MLQTQDFHIDFGQGLDQKTNPIYTLPGRLLAAQNVVFAKNGSIKKRFGYSPFTKTLLTQQGTLSTISSGQRLATFKNELLLTDQDHIQSYSPADSMWLQKDAMPEATVRTNVIGTAVTTATVDPDVIYGNGYYVASYFVSGNLAATVVDATTGVVVRTDRFPVISLNINNPKLVVVQNTAILVFIDFSASPTNKIRAQTLDLTNVNAGWSASVVLRSDMNNTARAGFYDVCAMSDRFVIIYESTTLSRVDAYSYNTSLSLLASWTTVVTAQPQVFALHGTTGENLWFAWAASATVNYLRMDPATLSPGTTHTAYTGSATPFQLGVTRVSATDFQIVASDGGTNTPITRTVRGNSAAIIGNVRSAFNLFPTSRPFTVSGNTYFYGFFQSPSGLANGGGIQGTYYLMNCENGDTSPSGGQPRMVIPVLPRQMPVTTTIQGYIREQGNLGQVAVNGTVATVMSMQFVATGATSFSGTNNFVVTMFDFANTNLHQPVELGDNTLFAPGVAYDGTNANEICFPYYPDAGYITTSTGAGGMAAGTYQYVVTYEAWDAKGQIHRSSPSTAFSVTVGASSSVTLTIPTLGFTNRQDVRNATKVGIAVYRTTVGPPSPPIFYRLTSPSAFAVTNDTSVQTVTYVDTASDTGLSSHQFVYTTGGVMPNVIPSAFSIIQGHKGRVWGVDPDGKTLWYSKQHVAGEGVNFTDTNTIRIEEGGSITGLASMDDNLIVFKSDRVFVINGEGPSDLGSNSDYTYRQLSSDSGCTDPRSIVLTPFGVMFRSQQGVYTIDRGLQVSYTARQVEDTAAANPVIPCVTLVPSQGHVRFAAVASEGATNGVTLVYDYVQNQWSYFSLYDSDSSTGSVGVKSSVLWNGIYLWMTKAGQVHQESTSSYLDSGSQWVYMIAQIAHIKPDGIAGYQRVRRLVATTEYATANDMSVSVQTNYGQTSQVHTYPNSVLSAIDYPIAQVELRLVNPKAESMTIVLSDSPPTSGSIGTGQGSTWTGITLELALKKGPFRVPSTAKA